MKHVDWYFDFISPYAYLSCASLHELGEDIEVRAHPILFAALLNHWGHKGPAEIPEKRVWTYRSCTWIARRDNISFSFPAVHPFNPIAYLRLAHACDCRLPAIQKIFDVLWNSGADPREEDLVRTLAGELNIDPAIIHEQSVKDALRARTEDAITKGVFGVPTYIVEGEQFWGADSMAFLREFLDAPQLLQDSEMQRVSNLPTGVQRKS